MIGGAAGVFIGSLMPTGEQSVLWPQGQPGRAAKNMRARRQVAGLVRW